MKRLTLALIGLCLHAQAHPMGNFSVSHYARFDLHPDGIELTYALDLAELPVIELLQEWDLNGRERAALEKRAVAQAPGWLSALRISIGGKPVHPRLLRAVARAADGAGGLAVLRVVMYAGLPASAGALEYRDTNYAARSGWKEIVIVPHQGVRIDAATQTALDRTRALEAYPTDPGIAPPQDVEASFRWRALVDPLSTGVPRLNRKQPDSVAAPPAFPAPGPLGTVVRGDYLSRMLGGREITLGMLLLGALVAFGLGAMHALSPGHGKTLVAAYLVGSRGAFQHALLLGAAVTFTHTSTVFALGIGVLFFQEYVAPEKIIPLLGALSGLSIVLIGAMLLYQRARALGNLHHHGHIHHHTHPHPHAHPHPHEHVHAHGGPPHTHSVPDRISLPSLIALGVSGGLVPCPSALVLLLSSIALGRPGLGLLLLTAFSLGLALVLVTIGIAVLYAKNLLPDRARAISPALRYVPIFSAGFVTLLGLAMTGVSLGWIQPGRFLG